jgi:hypothetical protein
MTSLISSLFNLAICGMAAAYLYEKWQARNKGRANPENEPEASQPKRAKGQQSGQFQLHEDLEIEVQGTQFEAPDSDGDSSASVIFSTENTSQHDLERFIARIWFETTDGHLLGGGLAEIEESVSTEDTSSMTANVNLIRLGGRTEGVRTHLSIIGCSAQRTKLERRTLPRDEGEEFVIFQSKRLAEGLTIEKVTVVISENEDGGGQLKLFYLVRNETFRSFPHIEIKTKLLSKTGKDLEFTETAESIQPFSVGVIYDYIVLEKISVLKNCQIECEAVVYEPVVIGEAQGTSMAILEAEQNEDDDDSDTDENSDSEDDAAEEDSQDELDTAESGEEDEEHEQEASTEVFTVRFAMTKTDGWNLPSLLEMPADKRNIAFIRSCMEFCPDFQDIEDKIKSYEIVDDGLEDLALLPDGTLEGYPHPTVRIELNEPLDAEDVRRGVFLSSYKLEIPGLNDGSPLFYEDHNGYTEVIDT